MRKLLILSLALVVAAPAALLAGEHPKEHPSSHEHPKKKARKKKKAAGKWVHHKETMAAFVQAVEDHIALKQDQDGSFDVRDDKLGKTWHLELESIHKKRIARLGADAFFACADFAQKDGKNKLDLDFYVSRQKGRFVVDQVLVHKVNGKPRYTYNSRNERVPVGGKAKKARPKRAKPTFAPTKQPSGGAEHPSGGEHPSGSEHPH